MSFIYTMTDAWNNAGTSFRGFKLAITDTASAADSLALEILGGPSALTNLISVSKAGLALFGDVSGTAAALIGNGFTRFAGPSATNKTFTLPNASASLAILGSNIFTGLQFLPDGTKAAPGLAFSGETGLGFFRRASGIISLAIDAGKSSVEFCSSIYGAANEGLRVANGIHIGASANDLSASGTDCDIFRATTGVIGINSGTVGGTLRYLANSPAQITADQNNYTVNKSYFQRWLSDASRTVTGLTLSQPQVDGQTHMIWNIGAQNIVLANEHASSTAANRFTTSTGADITLAPNKCAFVIYSGTTSRWLVCLGN